MADLNVSAADTADRRVGEILRFSLERVSPQHTSSRRFRISLPPAPQNALAQIVSISDPRSALARCGSIIEWT
jgi:hypothetical protein